MSIIDNIIKEYNDNYYNCYNNNSYPEINYLSFIIEPFKSYAEEYVTEDIFKKRMNILIKDEKTNFIDIDKFIKIILIHFFEIKNLDKKNNIKFNYYYYNFSNMVTSVIKHFLQDFNIIYIYK